MTTQISAANIQASTLENLGGSPTITQVQVCDSSFTVLDDTAVGLSGGFIKILGTRFVAGCQVLIDQVAATSVSFISSTELRVTVPALVAGTYILYVVNTDGSTAIRVNALTASEAPAWISDSTLLGDQDVAISIQLSATGATTYAVASGSQLPTGLTLSSSGLLSGTVTGLASETIFNFIVDAIDLELQDSPRSFAITITVGDPNIRYVTTLLSPNLEVAPFNRDASTNNFAVSVAGDARPNNFGPYTPGYYSNYFDGTGDYLSAPSNSAFAFGSGNFTVECWVYLVSVSNNDIISKWNAGGTAGTNQWLLYTVSSVPRFIWSTDGSATAGTATNTALAANRWYHLAAVRNGSSITLYVDGVGGTPVTVSGSLFGSETEVLGISYRRNNGATQTPFNGYTSNVRIVKGTAVYTANFTPPTEPLTAIANTSLLTCQSNRFIDNSTNNFAITRVGDTRISAFDPFVVPTEFLGRGSTYFDGTGDYLQTPGSNSAFQLAGDFTFECWFYSNSATVQMIFDTVQPGINGGSSSRICFFVNSNRTVAFFTGSISNTTNTINLGAWNHLALTRAGSTQRIFINGVESYSGTHTNNYSSGFCAIGVDAATGGTAIMNGYLSDIRLVKGTALYTANFTPPTQPLTAVANTGLLTCQTAQPHNNNQFLDSSTNNFLITRAGNTTQGTFSPYGGGWSNYFDGTGDYLTMPFNASTAQWFDANYTIEMWVYNTVNAASAFAIPLQIGYGTPTNNDTYWAFGTNASGNLYFYYYNGAAVTNAKSTATVPLNSWNHVAMVYTNSNTTLTGYINGVQAFSVARSGTPQAPSGFTLNIGAVQNVGYRGSISNLRIVKGTAVYTANFTPATAPLQPIAGTSLLTCADNRFVDDSANNFAVTRAGDVRVEKFNPFGIQTAMTPLSHSAFFDGTGDYMTVPATSSNFGTGDFTIECWFYRMASTSVIISNVDGGTNVNYFDLNSSSSQTSAQIRDGSGQAYAYGPGTATNSWNHIAVTRLSGLVTVFVNGVSGTPVTITKDITNRLTIIGAFLYTGFESYCTGWISNLRIVKGTAVYTANFTPATQPLTAVSGTSLLTCQNSTFVDNSSNRFAITAAGNVRPSQTNPFGFTSGTKTSYTPQVYGGSAYFDGTGDYLTVAPNAQTHLSSGPFTMEAWVYPTANNGMIAGRRSAVSARGFLFGFDATNKIRFWAGDSEITSWNVQLTSANTYDLNQWYHIVATRNSSNVFNLWVNGTSVANATASFTIADDTSALQIGTIDSGTGPFSGYMTDFRFVKGSALYTSSFVPPAAPLEPIINTTLMLNGTAAVVRDASMSNNLETVGDAKVSTSVVKYGTTSMAFDGTGDYLAMSGNTVPIGTGDFTIEGWFWLGAIADTYYNLFSFGAFGIRYGNNGFANRLQFGYDLNTLSSIYSCVIQSGNNAYQWKHIAWTRSGGVNRLFFDGVQQNLGTGVNPSTYPVASFTNSSSPPVGGIIGGGWLGYIQDFRITRGLARYTANFTPPTGAFKVK